MKGHFKNILCVLYDTHDQDELVAQAVHIAKQHQATLTIMLVLEPLPPNANMVMQSFAYLESQSSMTDTATTWLDEKISGWKNQYEYAIASVVTVGALFFSVINHVVNRQHDLVVKLAEHELSDTITGSDDMHLLRKCPCPVWIIHRGQSRNYKNVVAALDLNYHYPKHEIATRKQLALDILRYSAHIALLEFAQLHIVHVYDAVPESILRNGFISVDENALEQDLHGIYEERNNELSRLLGELKKELGEEAFAYLKPDAHLVHGYPRREIALTANICNADAIVMGTLSRLGVPGYIMGGTAEETIQQLNCAVIGIKPPGFVTPVKIEE